VTLARERSAHAIDVGRLQMGHVVRDLEPQGPDPLHEVLVGDSELLCQLVHAHARAGDRLRVRAAGRFRPALKSASNHGVPLIAGGEGRRVKRRRRPGRLANAAKRPAPRRPTRVGRPTRASCRGRPGRTHRWPGPLSRSCRRDAVTRPARGSGRAAALRGAGRPPPTQGAPGPRPRPCADTRYTCERLTLVKLGKLLKLGKPRLIRSPAGVKAPRRPPWAARRRWPAPRPWPPPRRCGGASLFLRPWRRC